ncbi:MAG: hypothetical protein IT292_12290 [Deltaproteobacteria bacterium]|nr:hypothetical protein [Deltaproteobacteria bacterium]
MVDKISNSLLSPRALRDSFKTLSSSLDSTNKKNRESNSAPVESRANQNNIKNSLEPLGDAVSYSSSTANSIQEALGPDAELVNENIESAQSQLEDVDAATTHAEATGSKIKFGSDEAVDAHSNLDPQAVNELLKD